MINVAAIAVVVVVFGVGHTLSCYHTFEYRLTSLMLDTVATMCE